MALVSLNSINLIAKHTETRNVGTYDGIHIAGSYEVTLVSGSEGTIHLKGNEDDLEKIESKNKNGTLLIKQKEKSWFDTWDTDTVYITIPVEYVSKIILSGSGEISSSFPLTGDHFKATLSGSGDLSLNLEVTHLNATLTGSGNINLRGTATATNYEVTGSGEIQASSIKATNAEAKITGSGDIEMYASETLNAIITGSGDIACGGNPGKQITKVTGSGDIIVRD